MTIDVHRAIVGQIEQVLIAKGYRTRKQLEANPRIKSRLVHGFDTSKFNAASVFYLPVQASNPKESFFTDFGDEPRGPLDVVRWIENCILTLEPIVERETAATRPTCPVLPEGGSDRLSALRTALLDQQSASYQGKLDAARQAAIEDWRMAPKSTGHDAFYRLAAKLAHAGMDLEEINTTLRQEAGFAHSPKDRRGEIKGIMVSLRKRGAF